MTNRLTLVADIYIAAGLAGMPPTKAVREHFDISQSTAGAWVAQARAEGLLPRLGHGKSGARNVRALRVAKALGVEYDDLIQAVVRHAGGRLVLTGYAGTE